MSLLPFNQALEQLLATLPSATQTEYLPLDQAANRVCAEAIYSPISVPSFDNSAMDGYALKWSDLSENRPLVIIGKALAGSPFAGELQAGQAVRITTGAMLPSGADTVVMQEDCQLDGENLLWVKGQPCLGEHIRRVGEDVKAGSQVLRQGSLLNVTTLPLLASLGISHLSVFKRVKVAILSTGDELVGVGQPLASGQIYDTNRFAVRLMLEKLGCEIIDFGILPDDPVQFERIFYQAQQQADVLISSGGVSVGEADFTKTVLEKLGQVQFWKIAMKPGKPFAFGKLPNAWFFGLPGNPVSALVTFYQLVQPALLKLSGVDSAKIAQNRQYLTACCAKPLKKTVGRQDFQRGFYQCNAQGQLEVYPVGQQGSHLFSAFYESNCFIVLEQARGDVAQGEQVMISPFNALLS